MKTKTVTIEGSIYMGLESWNKGVIDFCQYRKPNDECWNSAKAKSEKLFLAPYTIEIEIPDGIDMHKAILTSLQEKRKLILAENHKRIEAVDDEIQNHLALENKA